MKIICLIRPEPASIYLVNRIHREHPVSMVVCELPKPGDMRHRLFRKFFRTGFKGLWQSLVIRRDRARDVPRHRSNCEREFGKDYLQLDEALWVESTRDLNQDEYSLKGENADLIIVHGTSLLGPEILSSAPVCLNLHWGLSPWYRGINCTEWALLNRDPLNIGVTIHRLSKFIDGGEILSQARAEILPDDDVHAINQRLTRMGTELLLKALDAHTSGKEWKFHPQDRSQGRLYQGKDWSFAQYREVRRLIASGGIREMLSNPGRKPLPILEKG